MERMREGRKRGNKGGKEEGRKGVCMNAVCVTVKQNMRLLACSAYLSLPLSLSLMQTTKPMRSEKCHCVSKYIMSREI